MKIIAILFLISFSLSCQRYPDPRSNLVNITISPGILNADNSLSPYSLPNSNVCWVIAFDFVDDPAITQTPHCNMDIERKTSIIYGPFGADEVAEFSIPTGTHNVYVFATLNSTFCAEIDLTNVFSSSLEQLLSTTITVTGSDQTESLIITTSSSGNFLSGCANGVTNVSNGASHNFPP